MGTFLPECEMRHNLVLCTQPKSAVVFGLHVQIFVGLCYRSRIPVGPFIRLGIEGREGKERKNVTLHSIKHRVAHICANDVTQNFELTDVKTQKFGNNNKTQKSGR